MLLVFGKSGNARAFSSGTSNRDLTPALFLYVDATYSIAIVSLGESEPYFSTMKLRLLIAAYTLLFLSVASASCQQLLRFSVAEFAHDPLDLTARSDQHKRMDDNGALYSIIKVKSNLPDDDLKAYSFDFGLMNSSVEYHPETEELWVYIQKNAKIVSISRDGYVSVSKYDLRTTIDAGATYNMLLSVAGPTLKVQMVLFRVKPSTAKAVVMVKGEQPGAIEEMLGIVDERGAVAKSLPFGSYSYRVAAENFYPSEGRFTLNSQTENHVEDVSLRSNFGNITLNVESDADIFVDGEKRGKRSWTGVLKAGSHQVECRQANHKSSVQTITVAENETRTITLTPPTSITGALSIISRPLGAKISIDGKEYGETPKNITGLLVGNHIVEVLDDSGNRCKRDFNIQENQTTTMDIEIQQNAIESPYIPTSTNDISANPYLKKNSYTPGQKGNWSCGIDLSFNFRETTGAGFGLKCRYGLHNYIREEINFSYYFMESAEDPSAFDITSFLNTHFFFLSPRFICRPYIIAGIGYAHLLELDSPESSFGVLPGLGVDLQLYKFSVQLETGLIFALSSESTAIQLNLGFSYTF